jgi:hypothetical protein
MGWRSRRASLIQRGEAVEILRRDFGPPLMGGPVPATTSPGRNEDRDVTPPVVRDRASASVAEDSAGKLAAGPAPSNGGLSLGDDGTRMRFPPCRTEPVVILAGFCEQGVTLAKPKYERELPRGGWEWLGA